MPKLTIVFAAAIAFILSLAAVRAAELTPEKDAELRAQSQKILDAAPGAAAFWQVEIAGTLVHKQSGLPCLAAFTSFRVLTLTEVTAFPSKETDGDHVACQYGSADRKSRATIFLVRYQGEDIESEFEQTWAVIQAKYGGEPSDIMKVQ